ncbi:MAG: nitrate reductase associated protein [Sandaracinaceae bacterium]
MIEWLEDEPRDLVLMPMCVRRGLDRAGRKVSLAAWQAMSMEARVQLAELGSAARVDVRAIERAVPDAEPIEARPEPSEDTIPAAVARALPELDAERWRSLGPIGRHAAEMYVRKDRVARAREIIGED